MLLHRLICETHLVIKNYRLYEKTYFVYSGLFNNTTVFLHDEFIGILKCFSCILACKNFVYCNFDDDTGCYTDFFNGSFVFFLRNKIYVSIKKYKKDAYLLHISKLMIYYLHIYHKSINVE